MADEWGEGGDGKDIDKNENKGEKKMGSAGGNKENRDGAKVFQMKRVKRKQKDKKKKKKRETSKRCSHKFTTSHILLATTNVAKSKQSEAK